MRRLPFVALVSCAVPACAEGDEQLASAAGSRSPRCPDMTMSPATAGWRSGESVLPRASFDGRPGRDPGSVLFGTDEPGRFALAFDDMSFAP